VVDPIGLTASVIEIATFGHKVLHKAHKKLKIDSDERAFLEVVRQSIGQVVKEIPGLAIEQQQAVFDALSELLLSVEPQSWLGATPAREWPENTDLKIDWIPPEFRHAQILLMRFRTRFWSNLKSHGARADSPLHNLVSLALLDNIAKNVELSHAAQGTSRVTPFQVPPRVLWFAGRQEQLADIGAFVFDTDVPVVVISGRPGIGKTALVTNLAHDLRQQFLDGVLYVDLGIGNQEISVESVLRDFLDSVLVTQDAIPSSRNALISTYRSIMAQKHCLLVLDNASEEQQILPLLPARGRSAVVITTRYRSLSYVASKHVILDPLVDSEALALFSSFSKVSINATNSETMLDVVNLCDNVPLAIRLAASRFTSRREWRLEDLRSRLLAEGGKLRVLRSGRLSMASSLTLSYDGLGDTAKRALRLLSFSHLPQFPAWALAALLDAQTGDVELVIDELNDASLLEELGPDFNGNEHFRLHDLVAEFGESRAEQEETSESLDAAAVRIVGAYSRLLDYGARTLEPDIYLSGPELTVEIWSVDDQNEADVVGEVNQWFIAERSSLLSLVRLAERLEDWNHTWILSYRLIYFLDFYAYWQDWAQVQSASARAAEELNDATLRAYSTSALGDLYRERGDFIPAIETFDECLQLLDTSTSAPDSYLRGRALLGQGEAYRDRGIFDQSIDRLNSALQIFEELPADRYAAVTRFGLGGAYRALGDFEAARVQLNRAQEIFGLLGDTRRQALALRSLGATERELDLFDAAENRYEQCLVLFVEVNDRRYQAVTKRSIATLRVNQGRLDESEQLYAESLFIFQQLGDVRWEALTRVGLGAVQVFRDELAQAQFNYVSALEVLRRLNDRRWESLTHLGLSVAYLEEGKTSRTRTHVGVALSIFEELGDSRRLEAARAVQALINQTSKSQRLFSTPNSEVAIKLIDAMISD